jgi:SH3 domain-containing YSC84-like protein 1
MKKFLLVSLVAVCGAVFARADSKSSRADLVARVETCEAILEDFQRRPETAIRPEVWQKARAVVIVNSFKAGFLLGVKGGYGVILVKKADGQWSIPVLINAGEASVGLQAGANAIETIYIITNDNTPRLLFKQRFNIGVDAKAVAGPKAAEAETFNRELLETPVLVYSKARGLYAGATVKTGFLSRNDEANFALYRTNHALPELLYSNWVEPVSEVKPLMELVKKYAQ